MKKQNEPLGGTTLKVYLKLLMLNKPVGVRELQRLMNFKSPSTSKYHLDKLLQLGYVIKDEKGNYIPRKNENNIISLYVSFLGLLIPRFILYAVFVTTFITIYLVLKWPNIDIISISISLLAAIFLWIEGIKAYNILKTLKKINILS